MKQPLMLLLAVLLIGCTEDTPTDFSNALIRCEFGRANPLPVGGVLHDSSGGATFCVEAKQPGIYALVPFLAGSRDTVARVTVSIFGAGLAAAPTTLDVARPSVSLQRSVEVASVRDASDALHTLLRDRENATLRGHVSIATASAHAATTSVPVVGDSLLINVSTDCLRLDRRKARVAYVSAHAIVTFDPANPTTESYTQDDWRTFGRLFDELIRPTLLTNFGQETDIDGNGRVILFFTRAVNELVPPGSVGIAGGFFWRGDLYPRSGASGNSATCGGSNEGEVLYLAVPDPAGEVRGVPVSYRTLREVIVATIGHEFQHLINGGHRLYVTHAPVFEETWLNEGLSYMAEELLFYQAAGLSPKQNLNVAAIVSSQQRVDAFNQYAVPNLGRLNVFLQAPQDWSPMGRDGIPTRGAAWSFLRYVSDRDPRPDAQLFRALIDGQSASLDNLTAALGQDPLPWMQDWSLSLFADDFVPGLSQRFQQPSWDLRNLISALRPDQSYPLRILPLEGHDGFSVRLQPGSAAYPVFTLAPNSRAIVVLQTEGETRERTLRTALIRVQ